MKQRYGKFHWTTGFERKRKQDGELGVPSFFGLEFARRKAVKTTTLEELILSHGLPFFVKIDVEGYEEPVLRGGARLLHDLDHKPRLIYIELHPYAWSSLGVTSSSLLDLLASYHYEVSDLRGQPVHEIRAYGEIVARCQANLM